MLQSILSVRLLRQQFLMIQTHRRNENEEKIKPAINLYFSIVKYDDMPIEMKYLNIVQALETYHARFKYNDLKKYKKHV